MVNERRWLRWYESERPRTGMCYREVRNAKFGNALDNDLLKRIEETEFAGIWDKYVNT
jgi:hypothetical protein